MENPMSNGSSGALELSDAEALLQCDGVGESESASENGARWRRFRIGFAIVLPTLLLVAGAVVFQVTQNTVLHANNDIVELVGENRFDFIGVGPGWCRDDQRKTLSGYVKMGGSAAECAAACQSKVDCTGFAYQLGKVVSVPTHEVVHGCSKNEVDPIYGDPRFAPESEKAGEAICCDSAGKANRHIDGTCISGWGGHFRKTWKDALKVCTDGGMTFCTSQAEVDTSCGKGCSSDLSLAWTQAAHRIMKGCSRGGSATPTTDWGSARLAGEAETAGGAICCDSSGKAVRHINKECIGLGKKTYAEALNLCMSAGMRLCTTQQELDTACHQGCSADVILAWTMEAEDVKGMGRCEVYKAVSGGEGLEGFVQFDGSTKPARQSKYRDEDTGTVCYRAVPQEPDHHYEGADPFPNIELVTRGYNTYEGDPSPITASSDSEEEDYQVTLGKVLVGMKEMSMDPGLKKPLFEISYDGRRLTGDRRHTVPDGYHVTVDMGCTTAQSSKSIRDSEEYKTEQMDEVSATPSVKTAAYWPSPGKMSKTMKKLDVTAGVSTSVSAGMSAKLSYQFKDIQEQNRLRDQKMYRSSAKCSTYVAALSLVAPPKTHPDFQRAVDKAGTAEDWYKIFDEYGTHMLSLAKAGARFTSTTFVSTQSLEDVRKTANGIGVSVDAVVGAALEITVGYKEAEMSVLGSKSPSIEKKWAATLLSPKEKGPVKEVAEKLGRSTVSVIGPALPPDGASLWYEIVKTNPVPFKFDSRDICMHPAIGENQDKFCLCFQSTMNYCTEHLVKRGASCEVATEKECWADLDCDEGNICRNHMCLPLPQCEGTAWTEERYGGESFKLPKIDVVRNYGGAQFSLKNGNFADRTKSFSLSDGCLKVEMVDDDGNCVLGKKNNLVTKHSQQMLKSDLRNDICMVRLEAKPAPPPRPQVDRAGWVDLSPLRPEQSSTVKPAYAFCARDQDTKQDWSSQSCTLTETSDSPWWQVDLGDSYAVETVRIYARDDVADLSTDLLLWVDGVQCTMNAFSIEQGGVGDIPCAAAGRKLKIAKQSYGSLSICEVEVFAKTMTADPPCVDTLPGDFTCNFHCPYYARKGFCEDEWSEWGSCFPGRNVPAGLGKLKDACRSSCKNCKKADAPAPAQVPKAMSMSCAGRRLEEDVWVPPTLVTNLSSPPRSVRRLSSGGKYLANVGKAMYGYNPYFGAPSSVEMAGTDPGFQHRPVWKTTYNQNTKVDSVQFFDVPGFKIPTGETPWPNKGNFTWIEVPMMALEVNIFWGISSSVDGAKMDCIGRAGCTGFTCNQDKSECSLSKSAVLVESKSEVVFAVRGRAVSIASASSDHDAIVVPDGWKATLSVLPHCDLEFQAEEIKSSYDFDMSNSQNLNPFGSSLSIGDFSFGFSFESKSFESSNSKYKKSMIKSTAECVEYTLKMDKQPESSTNFEMAVSTVDAEETYYFLFNMFGLFYPTEVVFGARYGFTEMITESSYKTEMTTMESMSVSVEYAKSYEVSYKSVDFEATASIKGEYASKDETSQKTDGASGTEEKKEFSLGRKLPRSGGAEAWIAAGQGEAMPIRWQLESICEHPAWGAKKANCEKYKKTFCGSFLARMDPQVRCDRPKKPQCLWDMDCGKREACHEGTCVPEPDCKVMTGGVWYGPYYYSDTPQGRLVDLEGKKVGQVTITGGCGEVVMYDEDKCKDNYVDNGLLQNWDTNEQKRMNLGSDLKNDVCAMKVKPKKNWLGPQFVTR